MKHRLGRMRKKVVVAKVKYRLAVCVKGRSELLLDT
jgi:hypothetical protein